MDEAEQGQIAEEEAIARAIEQAAGPEVDARQQDQPAAQHEEAATEPEPCLDFVSTHQRALSKRWRISAAARAVSSGGVYCHCSSVPLNGRVMPASRIRRWKRANFSEPPSSSMICTGLPVAAASLIMETESAEIGRAHV